MDEIYIRQHAVALKLKAAQNYNISPEKCHMGHVILQGLLDRPHALNQVCEFFLFNWNDKGTLIWYNRCWIDELE